MTRGLLAETGLYHEEARQTWQQRVGAPLIKLTFVGDPTLQPVLDVVGKEAGARFNLVSGTLSEIKGTPFGQLVAGVIESEAPLESLPELFASHGVRCEVL
ncbi:NIL domain-containing protein [Chromobacterium haemolyticum]|uniref:NIL domain-containing protein n=1 Tax=Chromobacterium haemolyticum TaxID=394935 RepID=UPI0027154175|nr:NIL domain-containing protein [Chromobacterium sp. Rain0013]